MLINFTNADGITTEIEVNEDFGNFYLTSIKEEESSNRRETRRHTSLAEFTYEDARYFDSGVDVLSRIAESDAVRFVLDKLTERERFLILAHYQDEQSYTALATAEGKSPSTIMRETNKATDKFKAIYTKI